MRCVVAALTSSTSAPFTEAGNQDAVRLDHAGNKQWGGVIGAILAPVSSIGREQCSFLVSRP